jgi:hypothetical protein
VSEQEQHPSLEQCLLLLVDRLDILIDQNSQLIQMLAGEADEEAEVGPKLDLAGRPQ